MESISAWADIEFKNNQLVYRQDDKGNRVPDFSYAGYRAGEAIPFVPAKLVALPSDQDCTELIQAALDQVSQFDISPSGFRGAVLLPPGKFLLNGSLQIRASGVVLRGSGMGENGTILLAAGTNRRTLVEMAGQTAQPVGQSIGLAESYVPVNATEIKLLSTEGLSVGDTVRITHPSTKEWIAALGMNDFGGDRHGPSWRPGSRDIHWDRQITRILKNTITIDAPVTMGLQDGESTCTVTKLDSRVWLQNVGVENLRIVSTYDPNNLKDEEHAWFGIGIRDARDVWVRRVTCQHLTGSAVVVWHTASRVTVEDCMNLDPIGEIGGWRRNSFLVCGQQVLMQRLYSERGLHDFAVGLTAAGPNAFVQCESMGSLGESGTIDSAACGTLFDRIRIDGQGLSLRNRMYQGQGIGWTSFNGVLWNSSASVITNEKPPTAQNWAFGTHGEFSGNGAWFNSDDSVDPDSLYYGQLESRLGKQAVGSRALLNLPVVQGSRAPTLEKADEASEVSKKSRVTMREWIDHVVADNPIDISSKDLPVAKTPRSLKPTITAATKELQVSNGWISIGGKLACGQEVSVPWWNGGIRPNDLQQASAALTRFVPGRVGPGLTDDIPRMAERMAEQGQISVWQHPPLWYDRRRDDHSRVQRLDGEVVAPFYETPWARTGRGIASDGLSKWDVTKSNPWYFGRLRQFARVGSEKGLILFNGLYMQHSVLEAGAHYVDAPWRPANNVNPVGIPEPVFFAGDKLVYVAEQFYDLRNADLAALHKAYMTNVLNELADSPNVILFLSEEYTGPLAFVEFWLDVVLEWKTQTRKQPSIALYATKDVTDAILSDSRRSTAVSLIYNRFNGDGWWYQPDGSLYMPQGGKNLAPRQWSRLLKPKNASFHEVHQAVREYRLKYPDKPFVYQGPMQFAWAVVLGGGSLPPLPATTDPKLLTAIPKMKPMAQGIGLEDQAGNQLIYTDQKLRSANVHAIDMKTGLETDEDSQLLWIGKW